MSDIDEEQLRRESTRPSWQEARPGPAGLRAERELRHQARGRVISGKGVGKSFVTGIIAVELARRGAKVGVLDADITGPSIPRMLGLSGARATGLDDMLVPVTSKGGVRVMSANLVLESETEPVLWRGPVVANAIKQFYSETIWGDIDYLLVDMPPGTSDVALTVFQSLPIEGVVIVSSPQDLVQMVVGKAVNMANLMHVPVFGLVENMAYVECPHCGERIEPYGPSHLTRTAEAFGRPASLPHLSIDPTLAAACDEGTIEDVLPKGFSPTPSRPSFGCPSSWMSVSTESSRTCPHPSARNPDSRSARVSSRSQSTRLCRPTPRHRLWRRRSRSLLRDSGGRARCRHGGAGTRRRMRAQHPSPRHG